MTLMDFDAIDAPAAPKTTRQVASAPTVRDTVDVTPTPIETRAFLAKPDAQWTWEDLRDYVVTQIEAKFGPWPRDSKKEYGIFKRFHSQWGALAPRIARYAFDNCDGWWSSAPIRIERFCKGSDPYFAIPIAERLT